MIVKGAVFRDRFGPIALVTGASSGIGRALARQLAAYGLDLVLVARRGDRLSDLALEVQNSHGTNTLKLEIDLADHNACVTILEETRSLDIGLVVSNAGFGFKGDHAAADRQLLLDIIAVNSTAPMLLTHGFIPRLRARGKGGILMISSVESLMGAPFSAAYGASKAFVTNFGEALWAELQPHGIDVLTICPGATDTEAAAKQGIDPSTLVARMQPEAVALFALDNLGNGPVLVSSDYYRAMFEQLAALPRREALITMANAIKAAIAP